jgi:hypothetical protein
MDIRLRATIKVASRNHPLRYSLMFLYAAYWIGRKFPPLLQGMLVVTVGSSHHDLRIEEIVEIGEHILVS